MYSYWLVDIHSGEERQRGIVGRTRKFIHSPHSPHPFVLLKFSITNRHQYQQLQTALESQIERHARFAAHYSVQECKAQIKSNCYMQLMKCNWEGKQIK
jgi:hypothetical protein